ncbi:MAG: glycosyltransferase family 4 protein [Omnitrophica WOR_2 bacterium]
MKIHFLLTQDLESPSGLGRYYPLAKELSRLGHTVSISALHSNYTSLQNRSFTINGIKVRYVAPMHVRKQGNIKSYYSAAPLLYLSMRAAWQLSRAALTIPADIIHIGKPHPMNSIAGWAAKYLRGRQVYLDCDDYEAESGHFQGKWQRQGIQFFEQKAPYFVDFITTNTYFTRARLLNEGISSEKIVYLSNGVDRDRFTPVSGETVQSLRRQLGLEGKQVIAFIGSISRPSHPVDLLLESFARLRQSIPGSVLLLAGGGDELVHIQRQVEQIGIQHEVLFPGRISPEQVPVYYGLADVAIDPVLDDGAARGRSPLKLFESWACGVPFVTCDVGDRGILLGSPAAGLLARPGDPDSLAERIACVLTDPSRANELRRLGFERVQAYYWDHLAKELEAIYLKNHR